LSAQQKNGVQFRIERVGQEHWIPRLKDLYAMMMGMKWRTLFALFALAFFLVNLLMAALYVGLGEGLIHGARPGSYWDAYFFSVHTITTIGYGSLSPATPLAELLVAIEAFLGLLGFAILTGIVFSRFSKPTAGIRFSSVAAISTRNNKPCLMLRLANTRGSEVIEAKVRVSILKTETSEEGHTLRRFHELSLSRSRTPLLMMTWIVMHTIDEESPLYGLSREDLLEDKMILMVSLTGLEGTFGQTVFAFHIYTAEKLLFGQRFVDVIEEAEDRFRLDFSKFYLT